MNGEKKREIRFLIWFLLVITFLISTPRGSPAKCPTRMGSIYTPVQFLVIARGTPNLSIKTPPTFQEAIEGANALTVDLSLNQNVLRKLTKQRSEMLRQAQHDNQEYFYDVILSVSEESRDYSKRSLTQNPKITLGLEEDQDIPLINPAFQEFLEWSTTQAQLKVLFLKLKIPTNEHHLVPALLNELQNTVNALHPAPDFKIVVSTPNKEILNRVKKYFYRFSFSFDRELDPVEITNYHSFTTVPTAMDFKNSFASIGFPVPSRAIESPTPDPWLIYKFILTLDFRIRDNYKRSTSNYIKIISWTFNDEKKIRCLINLGVDGIVTDNPKMLRRIALDMGKTLD